MFHLPCYIMESLCSEAHNMVKPPTWACPAIMAWAPAVLEEGVFCEWWLVIPGDLQGYSWVRDVDYADMPLTATIWESVLGTHGQEGFKLNVNSVTATLTSLMEVYNECLPRRVIGGVEFKLWQLVPFLCHDGSKFNLLLWLSVVNW